MFRARGVRFIDGVDSFAPTGALDTRVVVACSGVRFGIPERAAVGDSDDKELLQLRAGLRFRMFVGVGFSVFTGILVCSLAATVCFVPGVVLPLL